MLFAIFLPSIVRPILFCVHLCMGPFQVVSIPGRGLGCCATRDIAQGERLLVESPLTVQGGNCPSLERTVATLPLRDRERFFSLSQNEAIAPGKFWSTQQPGAKTPEGIAATNGIPFRHLGTVYGGIFPTTSRFNHSCCSNAAYKWNSALNKLTVHATIGIRKGDESATRCQPAPLTCLCV